MAVLYAFVALCFFGNALAQVPGFGACPNVTTAPNFDAAKYLGIWYEQMRYFATFELGAKCVQANYTAGENNTIGVVNSNVNALTGSPGAISGYAYAPDATEPAKLKVHFENVPVEGSYWVLGTDYINFAVVYSCHDVHGFINFKFAWILTRERNPPQSVVEIALEIAENNHVSKRMLLQTDQSSCGNSTA